MYKVLLATALVLMISLTLQGTRIIRPLSGTFQRPIAMAYIA